MLSFRLVFSTNHKSYMFLEPLCAASCITRAVSMAKPLGLLRHDDYWKKHVTCLYVTFPTRDVSVHVTYSHHIGTEMTIDYDDDWKSCKWSKQ
jgi:hypothetical protein